MMYIRIATSKWIWFIVFLNCYKALAQSDEVVVSIRLVSVYGSYDASNEYEDFRFNFWVNDEWVDNNCFGIDQVNYGYWNGVSRFIWYKRNFSLTQPIRIDFEAWEEDYGNGCTYNSSRDNGKVNREIGIIQNTNFGGGPIGGSSFTLARFPPGNLRSNEIELWIGSGFYRVKIVVTYEYPPLNSIAMHVDGQPYSGSFLCGNEMVTLSTGIPMPANYDSYLWYVWEYHVAGDSMLVPIPNPDYCGPCNFSNPKPGEIGPCCFESPTVLTGKEPRWLSLNTLLRSGGGEQISFLYRELYSIPQLLQNKSIAFRVGLKYENAAVYTYSNDKLTNQLLNVSPPPPKIDQVISEPSCPNNDNGIIHLNGMQGVGEYQYMLRLGFDNDNYCDPLNPNSCYSASLTGDATGADFSIENIPAGVSGALHF